VTDGHRTTSIPRPAGVADPTRITHRTDDTRLITRPRHRLLFGVGATVIGVSLAAAVLVLPVRAWMNQREELSARRAELETLDQVNDRLQADVDRLSTPEGIREAARADLGMVDKGSEIVSILPHGALPRTLPDSWPYTLVGGILTARLAAPAPAVEAIDDGSGVTAPRQ
jgi:cell division protein FtsB